MQVAPSPLRESPGRGGGVEPSPRRALAARGGPAGFLHQGRLAGLRHVGGLLQDPVPRHDLRVGAQHPLRYGQA